MKILNISNEYREGLACAASLCLRGHKVIHIHLGSQFVMDVLKVQLDTGIASVEYIEVPSTSTGSLEKYVKVLEQLIAEKFGKSPEVVITSSSRFSFHMAQSISRMYNVPLILRISDLGAAGKFKEALSYRWYRSMLELPVALVHLEKAVVCGNMSIAHTAAIFKFLECYFPRRSILIYPTYAKIIPKDDAASIRIINNIENSVNVDGHVILGVTMVGRRHGLAERHDERALKCLYLIAKFNPDVNVVVIGSECCNAKKVLGKCSLPTNIKFLGMIRNDLVLEHLYKKASLVVVPFFFRKTISNRLLEALFYGKPALAPIVLSEDFPWLKHYKICMFDECSKLLYLVRYILRSDDVLDCLKKSAVKAWESVLSDRIFGFKMNVVLKHVSLTG